MAAQHEDSGDPAAWIATACTDLDVARAVLRAMGEQGLHVCCYHAQQCVEKALKAWLIARKQPYPLTHDLRLLLDRCERAGGGWVERARPAERLVSLAATGRYPSSIRHVSRKETDEAISIADSVLNLIQSDLGN